MRLASLRKDKKKTAEAVATAWGCKRANVSHIENGRQSVSVDKLRAFAALVGCELAGLLEEPTEAELAAAAAELALRESGEADDDGQAA